jgi:glycosyltransferase involved in cell wall biosynthesis
MEAYEGSVCRRAKRVIAVSKADADLMEQQYKITGVHAVDTGVDTDYFRPPTQPAELKADLVFLGSMDWMPNIDGVQWFVREILPLIHSRRPDTRIAIVGRKPSPEILALAGDRIHVTGTVPDVRPWLWGSRASIVPLRIGGGTRLKIFEAMAMGKAVVSTTVGAEGLPVTHQQDILLADDDTSFAHSVVGLLRDIDARRRLEIASRRLVAEHFDWSVVARDLDDALVRCAGSANFIEWRKRSDEGLGIWSRICRQRVGGNARQ